MEWIIGLTQAIKCQTQWSHQKWVKSHLTYPSLLLDLQDLRLTHLVNHWERLECSVQKLILMEQPLLCLTKMTMIWRIQMSNMKDIKTWWPTNSITQMSIQWTWHLPLQISPRRILFINLPQLLLKVDLSYIIRISSSSQILFSNHLILLCISQI